MWCHNQDDNELCTLICIWCQIANDKHFVREKILDQMDKLIAADIVSQKNKK